MSDDVGHVLAALADPTRRAIFETVARTGPLTATKIAADLPISRQAVSKHLDRLAEAALVHAERIGRETWWSATTGPLETARRWFDQVGTTWDERLGRLSARARTARDD